MRNVNSHALISCYVAPVIARPYQSVATEVAAL